MFHEEPDTTYLLTTVILMEAKQYPRTDAPGLLSILDKLKPVGAANRGEGERE